MGFHSRKLGRLQPGDSSRAKVARDDLQHDANASRAGGDFKRRPVELVRAIAQQEPGVNSSGHKTGGNVDRKNHVQRFMKRCRTEHRGHWIDVPELAANQFKARGRIHPCIGEHYKNTGKDSAQGNNNARGPMRDWVQSIAPIKK